MATCKDCIHHKVCFCYVTEEEIESCVRCKNNANFVEVEHGRWIKYPHNSGIYCSKCRHKRRYRDIYDNYCPNCGAKMDGGEE